MKVLLLNPLYLQPCGEKYERYFIRSGSRWPHSGVKLKGASAHYLPFPFSLGYAAACLKAASFEVLAFDAVALNMPQAVLLQQIAGIKPEVVFFEFTTITFSRDICLAKKIKELTGATIVIGGAHAAYFAAEIIREHKFIDFIIRGNYENILTQLMKTLEGQYPAEIAGVVHSVDGEVVDNGYPLDRDRFEELRLPLRDIFPSHDRPDPTVYWDGFCQLRPALQIQSSRGCKYRCSFCLNARQEGKSSRYQAACVQEVCDDIQTAVQKYQIREFYFDDDDFVQDLEHVDRIFELLRKRKQPIKWSGMASFSDLTHQTIQRLAGYGCIGLKLGIESANSQVLKGMHKAIDFKSVAGIITCCRRCGIKTQLTFSLGFLDEMPDDLKRTIAYARSLDADSIQVSIATPLPGTEFFEIAQANNRLTNADWEEYDAKRTSVIILSGFDRQTLGSIRRAFVRGWFIHKALSFTWWLRHLPIVLRTLKGWGPSFFFKQLTATYIDESKNS